MAVPINRVLATVRRSKMRIKKDSEFFQNLVDGRQLWWHNEMVQ